jgi:hypothetical protein
VCPVTGFWNITLCCLLQRYGASEMPDAEAAVLKPL